MQDVDTEEVLVFPCHKWLSREEGDHEISREIPSLRKGEPHLPRNVVGSTLSHYGAVWSCG